MEKKRIAYLMIFVGLVTTTLFAVQGCGKTTPAAAASVTIYGGTH